MSKDLIDQHEQNDSPPIRVYKELNKSNGANLQHLGMEGGHADLRYSSGAKEVPQQRGVRRRQPPQQSGCKAREKTVSGASRVHLYGGERRNVRLPTVPVQPAAVPPLRDDHTALPPRRFHPNVWRLLRRRLNERHSGQKPRVRGIAKRHVTDGAVTVERPDQRLRVHEHRAAEPDHLLERLR
uniref:Uncharacterized protein n=1 Tax=Zea mays TaxID=4577 RepID=C0PJ65_MAIZE|nr:unknown [Zea mays]